MGETTYQKLEQASAPADKYNLAYIIMFFQGVGNLFPWNALITASSYFAIRFCTTAFAKNFENYFSFTYTFSQTVGLAVAIKFQNSLSIRSKIFYPLLVYSLVFVIITALVMVDFDSNALFYVTMLSALMCGLSGSILSAGLFGLGGILPAAYTGALMNGQGLAGLIVSLSNILTLYAEDPVDNCKDSGSTDDGTCEDFAVNYSALAYFIIATIILLMCAAAFLSLNRLQFTRYYMSRAGYEVVLDDYTHEPLLATNPLLETALPINNGSSPRDEDMSSNNDLKIHNPADDSEEDAKHGMLTFSEIKRVFSTILIPALSVNLTFTITIGLFPSLTVFLQSEKKCESDERFFNDLFVPIMFFLFNVFDFTGRLIAGGTRHYFTAKNIWMPAVARLVFFPLFLLCNVDGSQLPVVFSNDAFPLLIMILFALSNGYVASCCMMLGPSIVPVEDQFLAGTIMVFCLTCGLLFGAVTSFLTVFISQGKIGS